MRPVIRICGYNERQFDCMSALGYQLCGFEWAGVMWTCWKRSAWKVAEAMDQIVKSSEGVP